MFGPKVLELTGKKKNMKKKYMTFALLRGLSDEASARITCRWT